MEDKKKGNRDQTSERNQDFPGYKHYPENEDIYSQESEETEIDPEDITKLKSANEDPDSNNEKSFEESVTGDDLDVPGNEQDEENLTDVLPDEENNYYSLGGDNHENLEENPGMDKI